MCATNVQTLRALVSAWYLSMDNSTKARKIYADMCQRIITEYCGPHPETCITFLIEGMSDQQDHRFNKFWLDKHQLMPLIEIIKGQCARAADAGQARYWTCVLDLFALARNSDLCYQDKALSDDNIMNKYVTIFVWLDVSIIVRPTSYVEISATLMRFLSMPRHMTQLTAALDVSRRQEAVLKVKLEYQCNQIPTQLGQYQTHKRAYRKRFGRVELKDLTKSLAVTSQVPGNVSPGAKTSWHVQLADSVLKRKAHVALVVKRDIQWVLLQVAYGAFSNPHSTRFTIVDFEKPVFVTCLSFDQRSVDQTSNNILGYDTRLS